MKRKMTLREIRDSINWRDDQTLICDFINEEIELLSAAGGVIWRRPAASFWIEE